MLLAYCPVCDDCRLVYFLCVFFSSVFLCCLFLFSGFIDRSFCTHLMRFGFECVFFVALSLSLLLCFMFCVDCSIFLHFINIFLFFNSMCRLMRSIYFAFGALMSQVRVLCSKSKADNFSTMFFSCPPCHFSYFRSAPQTHKHTHTYESTPMMTTECPTQCCATK